MINLATPRQVGISVAYCRIKLSASSQNPTARTQEIAEAESQLRRIEGFALAEKHLPPSLQFVDYNGEGDRLQAMLQFNDIGLVLVGCADSFDAVSQVAASRFRIIIAQEADGTEGWADRRRVIPQPWTDRRFYVSPENHLFEGQPPARRWFQEARRIMWQDYDEAETPSRLEWTDRYPACQPKN